MSQALIGPSRKYDKRTIELALHELAWCDGSARLTERRLREKGVEVPCSTISEWKLHVHADRYAEIRAEVVPQIHSEIAALYEDQARAASRLALTAVQKNQQQLDDGDLTDPQTVSTVGRNAGVISGIATTHLLPMRDRPSVIVEHRDADALFRKLRSVAPTSVVDSTAEDITDDTKPPASQSTVSRTLNPVSGRANALEQDAGTGTD